LDDAVRRQCAAEQEGSAPRSLTKVERRQLLRQLPWHVRVLARIRPGRFNYGSSEISIPIYSEDDHRS
jgi:hypothetical protein